MTQRVYNFSPGPAVLPEPVLAEVQRDGTDNRGKLNEFFERQDVQRSKNVVSELGSNFDAAQPEGGKLHLLHSSTFLYATGAAGLFCEPIPGVSLRLPPRRVN